MIVVYRTLCEYGLRIERAENEKDQTVSSAHRGSKVAARVLNRALERTGLIHGSLVVEMVDCRWRNWRFIEEDGRKRGPQEGRPVMLQVAHDCTVWIDS